MKAAGGFKSQLFIHLPVRLFRFDELHGSRAHTSFDFHDRERAAAIYTIIGTAKLNGLDPEAYLRRILERLPNHPINRIAELLPWNLATAESSNPVA